ncbi:translation initiation factor IF-2-like [Phyllostomus discolor]|uniref:Translation initiation factor IF-2-like n=1 Tax=Phyllostomus discolor TaxID=89673 RepID=A0A7E6CTF6_9CHIR|nr:translation initiation factor IF-2-like [Phyllostomus discolor]
MGRLTECPRVSPSLRGKLGTPDPCTPACLSPTDSRGSRWPLGTILTPPSPGRKAGSWPSQLRTSGWTPGASPGPALPELSPTRPRAGLGRLRALLRRHTVLGMKSTLLDHLVQAPPRPATSTPAPPALGVPATSPAHCLARCRPSPSLQVATAGGYPHSRVLAPGQGLVSGHGRGRPADRAVWRGLRGRPGAGQGGDCRPVSRASAPRTAPPALHPCRSTPRLHQAFPTGGASLGRASPTPSRPQRSPPPRACLEDSPRERRAPAGPQPTAPLDRVGPTGDAKVGPCHRPRIPAPNPQSSLGRPGRGWGVAREEGSGRGSPRGPASFPLHPPLAGGTKG